jgi:dihydrofolate reductase
MNISIIVAASTNNVIGKENGLPWRLPTDMKFFRDKTIGHTVIMGRKSWDSIPAKYRPLPNRINVVMSRDESLKLDCDLVSSNLETVIDYFTEQSSDDELFIIGGGELYKQAFPIATKVYLTRVLAEVDGDTYLEGFKPQEWTLASTSEVLTENGFEFVFEEYIK